MPFLNPETKKHPLTEAIIGMIKNQRAQCGSAYVSDGIHVMSRMVDGFVPLSKSHTWDGDGKMRTFESFVVEFHRPPETVLVKDSEFQIQGMMEVLASARLLADTDVLGGSFNNAGFIFEDAKAIVVKIDPGCCFNFSSEHNKLFQTINPLADDHPEKNLADPKDIQYGNNTPHDIKWLALTR